MEDDVIRIKYRYLQSNLYNIQGKLDDIASVMEDLEADMKKSIIIDENYIEKDNFKASLEIQNDIYDELANEIIPIVSNRC